MWIDGHMHLDLYGDDLGKALAEIQGNRVLSFSNSLDLEGYRRTCEIAKTRDWVVPCVGIHPWVAVDNVHRLKEYEAAIAQAPMLGEVGLDYYFEKDVDTYPVQREIFDFFLRQAGHWNKIVNVHTKGAEEDVLRALQRHGVHRAIIHWYSGPLDVLHRLVEWDSYFTVGVEVRYSEGIRDIARAIPLSRLLLETDNPGGPRTWLGGPGMPVLLQEVAAGVAAARGVAMQELRDAVRSNWARLVSEDPWLFRVCGDKFGSAGAGGEPGPG